MHHKPIYFPNNSALLIRNEILGLLYSAMENSLALSTTKSKLSIFPACIFKTTTDTALSTRKDCKTHSSASFSMQGGIFVDIHLDKSRRQLQGHATCGTSKDSRECTAFRITRSV